MHRPNPGPMLIAMLVFVLLAVVFYYHAVKYA